MKKQLITLFLFASYVTALGQADSIIYNTILHYWGDKGNEVHFQFVFRDNPYEIHKNDGIFEYRRSVSDSNHTYTDILNNQGFKRILNQKEHPLNEKDQAKYSNALNSVVYFTLIPLVLNDPAVNKKYLGAAEVKNKHYHKIQITFNSEKGGEDYQDVYIYWISSDKLEIDYLAYSFHVNGGGLRFREAFNRRRHGGILFQDYFNYKPKKSSSKVYDLDQEFEKGNLEKISVIKTEKVKIKTGL